MALPFGDFAKSDLIISTSYIFELTFTVKLKFDDMTFLKKGKRAYIVTDNIEYEEIESDEILDYDFNINYETKDTLTEDGFILNFEEEELIDIECEI